jgi:hypothetical protein
MGNCGILAIGYFTDFIHQISNWHLAIDAITALMAIVALSVTFISAHKDTATDDSLSW